MVGQIRVIVATRERHAAHASAHRGAHNVQRLRSMNVTNIQGHIPATCNTRSQHVDNPIGRILKRHQRGPLNVKDDDMRWHGPTVERRTHLHTHVHMTGGNFEVIVCDTVHSRVIQPSYRAAKDTQPKLRSTMVYECEGCLEERTPLAFARLIASGKHGMTCVDVEPCMISFSRGSRTRTQLQRTLTLRSGTRKVHPVEQ
jgi:hypothetical protein